VATDCAIRTFVAQVPGVTQRHSRRTPGLRGLLERIALALAGRAGSRLARALGRENRTKGAERAAVLPRWLAVGRDHLVDLADDRAHQQRAASCSVWMASDGFVAALTARPPKFEDINLFRDALEFDIKRR